MSDDLRQLLHDTATPPTRPVDAAALVGRARRQRRGMQAASGLVVALVVMVVVVGTRALWPSSTPEVTDVPPSEATISALTTPRQPHDAIPDHIRDQIGLGERWAATSRLARETSMHDFYVYRDAPPELGTSAQVCLLVVPDRGDAWGAGCSADHGRTSHPVLTLNTGEVVAGLVYDGIDNSSQLEGDVVADRPVVNNVFTTAE